MNRQDVRENFFVADVDEIHDDFARLGSPFSQRGGNIFPLFSCNVLDFQRVPDEFQRNVVGHGDFLADETVADDSESLVALFRETLRLMRGDEKIKRRDVRQLRQPLKFVEVVAVVHEELGEFVPK